MRPIPDCVPDALNMIIATAKAVSDDDFIHRKVLLKVMGELADEGDLGSSPADIYLECWEHACRALGVKDPYENDKARGDKIALGILRMLAEQYTVKPGDQLQAAIRIAFAGAMLEFNILGRADAQEQISQFYQAGPALDQTDALIEAIQDAESIMIVANRAGEIAMDRPLAEVPASMGKKVSLAVAAKPVFFMATEKDADNAQFPDTISVINPGTAMYGLVPERSSSEFQDVFEQVDLVIVKGCTHYATLTHERELFFIMKGSEPEVAAELGIDLCGGAIVRVAAKEE